MSEKLYTIAEASKEPGLYVFNDDPIKGVTAWYLLVTPVKHGAEAQVGDAVNGLVIIKEKEGGIQTIEMATGFAWSEIKYWKKTEYLTIRVCIK